MAFGCGGTDSNQPPRCANCGMQVEAQSGWRAGATAAGQDVSFDTPKCMFRYLDSHPAEGESAWAVEYYSQERRPASRLLYVGGTDLEGPMGRDLVPVADEAAARRMREDHGGTSVFPFASVPPAVIDDLFDNP